MPRARPTALERLLGKMTVDPETGCWLWQAKCLAGGYGGFWLDGRTQLAHRVSYELHVGPIPKRLTIDHLCRVRHCINPEHMEVVTPRENTLRGIGPTSENAHKTHCVNGHEYNAENTYVTKQGWRSCRACHRMWDRARRARQAA